MSDILEQAKEAVELIKARNRSGKCISSDYADFNAASLLPELISEIERLRAEISGLVKSILSDDDKDKLIQVLETAYLDAKAARIYYEHVQDGRSWEDYPEEPCHMRPKESYREEAHERLEELWRSV